MDGEQTGPLLFAAVPRTVEASCAAEGRPRVLNYWFASASSVTSTLASYLRLVFSMWRGLIRKHPP